MRANWHEIVWGKKLLYLFTQFSLSLLDSKTECHKVTAFKDITFDMMYFNNSEQAAQ